MSDGIMCDSKMFGEDPLPGVAKNCLCLPNNSPHKVEVKLNKKAE